MPTKYNLNRKNISLLNEDHAKLEVLKDELKLKSLTETISVMVDVLQGIKLEKGFKCKKCGSTFQLPEDSNPEKIGLTHRLLGDPKCFGCIETSYRVKKDTNGTKESNDKNSGATDTSGELTEAEKEEYLTTITKFNENKLTQEERDAISPKIDALLTKKYNLPKMIYQSTSV